MEKWDYHHHHHKRQNREKNPSFSSTLLDSIYRSIEAEEEKQQKQDHLCFYKEQSIMRRQKQSNNKNFFEDSDVVVVGEIKKPNFRRNSLTEFDRRKVRSNYGSNSFSMFTSSSSSDSSSGYGFSSSESESWYKMQKPKPIRTSISSSIRPQNSSFEPPNNYKIHSAQTQKPVHEKNDSSKAKSKALKILYGDLKKSKQPISPGARLASFLHSLFNSSGNTKKPKKSSSSVSNLHQHDNPKVIKTQPLPCSSASSFSRSCLSKTPSSRSGASKRSVRFCPVSVIVDEDCRPCGQKNILKEDDQEKKLKNYNNNDELRFHVMKESRRVEEFARELLLKTKMKKEKEFEMKYGDEDEDDDRVSCASSDLFELDNLSSIGIQRYREELPVYETTHFDTNRAIANGFIL